MTHMDKMAARMNSLKSSKTGKEELKQGSFKQQLGWFMCFQGIVTLECDEVKNRGKGFLYQFSDKNRKSAGKFLESEGFKAYKSLLI